MFCKKCGNQVTETAAFCNKCGADIGRTSVSSGQYSAPESIMPTQSIAPYKQPLLVDASIKNKPLNHRTMQLVSVLSAVAVIIIIVVVIVNTINQSTAQTNIATQQAIAQMAEDARLAEEAKKAEEARLAQLAKVAEQKRDVIETIELWTMYTNNYDNEKANDYCAPKSGGTKQLAKTFFNVLEHVPVIGEWAEAISDFIDSGTNWISGFNIQIDCSDSDVIFAVEDKESEFYIHLPDDEIGKIAIVSAEVSTTEWGKTGSVPMFIILEKVGDKWLMLRFQSAS